MIFGLLAIKELFSKKNPSFWEQEDKVNELIAAYKAAANHEERDAVLEEYSIKHNVGKRVLRQGCFAAMYIFRK